MLPPTGQNTNSKATLARILNTKRIWLFVGNLEVSLKSESELSNVD